MKKRLACIRAPLFPLAARLRSEPELVGEAVAIFEGNSHNARVVAATRLARQTGVRPGTTLTQARALMPRLIARARDPECENTAHETLLEVAEALTPRVESHENGVAFLDIRGLQRHFRGPSADCASPELNLGNALLRDLDRAGLPSRVGIASNKLAAHVAAGLAHTPTIVAAGEEADFLAPLPLQRLSPQIEIAETLRQWGIRSIGEFAKISAADVGSRLGEAGLDLHAAARGLDPQPLIPRQPPPRFREGLSLEWPLVTLEPFLFLARAALDRLCQRLESRGLGCQKLDLTLRLDPDGRHERSITLPSPTRDVKTLLTLLRLDLEAHPPGAPVIGFALQAHPDRPRSAQLSLFGPAALSPEKLATTLARLFALLGAGRIGSPRTADGYRPERLRMIDYDPPPPPKVRKPRSSARGLLIVRTLKPAVALDVRLRQHYDNGNGNGSPLSELRILDSETARSQKLSGEIVVASGPWSLEERWWTRQPVQREYWDVEMRTGELLRIYRDPKNGRWYMDGIYD